jgi:hypothetical protein
METFLVLRILATLRSSLVEIRTSMGEDVVEGIKGRLVGLLARRSEGNKPSAESHKAALY